MKIRRLKILVIEGDDAIRRKLSTWIVQMGYSIYECDGMNKAMAFVEKIKPDIVIVNIRIKNQHTLDYVKVIAKDRAIRVILTSKKIELNLAQNYDFIRTNCTNNEFDEVVKKVAGEIYSLSIGNKEKNQYVMQAQIALMKKYHISEEQAYRFIQKRSMDNATKMEDIAKKISKIIEDEK